MRKITKHVWQALVFSMLLIMGGCGGGVLAGKKVMEIPELGVSMTIPAGWQLDNPQMCHKGEYTGILMDEPLAGKTFEVCADEMSKEFGSKIISTQTLMINGCKAIKTVMEYPVTETKILRVYIHKQDKIAVVSFVIHQTDYPQYEAALAASVKSIAVR